MQSASAFAARLLRRERPIFLKLFLGERIRRCRLECGKKELASVIHCEIEDRALLRCLQIILMDRDNDARSIAFLGGLRIDRANIEDRERKHQREKCALQKSDDDREKTGENIIAGIGEAKNAANKLMHEEENERKEEEEKKEKKIEKGIKRFNFTE